MKKSNLGLFIFIAFICGFSAISTCQSDYFQIEIPDRSFDSNINVGNRSDIFFETNGNDGFGLLFLGGQNSVIDHSNSPVKLTIGENSIECKKQLKGYYSTNYGNFHTLPIDSDTANNTEGNNATLIDGGLFYDCFNGTDTYDGVYGYIKRRIGDLGNTQEIRAGLNEDKDGFEKESPLKLVLSAGGYNRALSGNARDSLAQKSRFVARMPLHEFIQIWIPDEYFNTTAIFSENINEIYFNDAGNNGYGLFFLGTGIDGNYEIKRDGGQTLTCSTKLNGYYTISFTDFGIFPLDQETLDITANYPGTSGVNIENGGLYYNCKKGNETYNGVYGHIKWTYGINGANTHELRAGIDNNGNWIKNSPLELIYSENFRNTGRSLSGNLHSSLVKNSFVQNRFFGDMGLNNGNNIPPVGTIENHHYYIYYSDYIAGNIKIYLKSSIRGSTGIVILTGFDSNGQVVTGFQTEIQLSDIRSSYGFYGYTFLNFPYEENMRSGTISVTISNAGQNRSKLINFTIQPGQPKITITQNTECGKSITISATASDNATLKYRINPSGDSDCDTSSDTKPFNNNYTGSITFNDDNYNGRYICFEATNIGRTSHSGYQITGIDNRGPIVTFENQEVDECSNNNLVWSVSATDSCAGIGNNAYQFSDIFGDNNRISNYFITITPSQIGKTGNITKQQIVTVKDIFENTTIKTGTLTIKDISPSLTTQTGNIGVISGNYTYGNVIEKLGANEGICGTEDLTATLIGQCSNATGSTINNNNILTIIPNANIQGEGICTIKFTDNEGSFITGYVKFTIDTKAPTITITGPSPDCSTGKTVTVTTDETCTISYYTTGGACSDAGPYEGSQNTNNFTKTFNNESDNGKYVCFKAVDSVGNTSFNRSLIITGIDTTPPSFGITIQKNNLSAQLAENEIYECDTGTLKITNVSRTGCAGLHAQPYGRYGIFDTAQQKEIYTGNHTGTQIVKVQVQDILGHKTTKDQTIIWKDQQITGDTEISLGYVIGEYTINDIVSEFHIRGRGVCETLTVQTGEHLNATCEIINGTGLKIIPDENQDANGYCDVYFRDGDTEILGRINFEIKTKTYYISIDSTGGKSTGQVKSHIQYTEFNTGKIYVKLNNNNRIVDNTYNPQLGSELYEITSIKGNNEQNKWLDTDDIDIEISNIKVDDIDSELFNNISKNQKCSLRNYEFGLLGGFITDPAGNASEETMIITDNLYIYGDYLTLGGLNDFVKVTPKSNRTNQGMTLNILSRKKHEKGTGSVECISSDSCPGFSCDTVGFIEDMHEIDMRNQENSLVIIDGEPIMAPFYYSGTLQIDPLNAESLTPANREQRTGCKIKLIKDECEREIEFDIILKSYPIKAGKYGEEDYWADTLGEALINGGGDNGFLFFITRPDEGSLGNIGYHITFTGDEVADEFYYITGSAIVNGYYQNINIKRPTFNYYNPRSYMFIFP